MTTNAKQSISQIFSVRLALTALAIILLAGSLGADEPKSRSIVFEYKPTEGQPYSVTISEFLENLEFPVTIPATVDWVVSIGPDLQTETMYVSISDATKLGFANSQLTPLFNARFAMKSGKPVTVMETSRFKLTLTVILK